MLCNSSGPFMNPEPQTGKRIQRGGEAIWNGKRKEGQLHGVAIPEFHAVPRSGGRDGVKVVRSTIERRGQSGPSSPAGFETHAPLSVFKNVPFTKKPGSIIIPR